MARPRPSTTRSPSRESRTSITSKRGNKLETSRPSAWTSWSVPTCSWLRIPCGSSACPPRATWVVPKSLKRELFITVHPEAVRPVRLGGRSLDERAVRGIYAFTLLYLVIFFVAATLVYLDAARVGMDLAALDAMSATAATLGNVGPGFGIVGPMNNYLPLAASTKLFMMFLMWIGRLEILPVLILLTRAYWQS